MEILLTAVVSLAIGAVFSFLLCCQTIRRLNRRVRTLRAGHVEKKKKMETTKKVVWICLVNGFIWVWCSYVLAYLDKPQIAESLSQVAVTEIIGVVLAYCIKSSVENLSKNNHWPDKNVSDTPVNTETENDTTGKG